MRSDDRISFNTKIDGLFLFNSWQRKYCDLAVRGTLGQQDSGALMSCWRLNMANGNHMRGSSNPLNCSYLSLIKWFTLLEPVTWMIGGVGLTGSRWNTVFGEFFFQNFLWLAVDSSPFHLQNQYQNAARSTSFQFSWWSSVALGLRPWLDLLLLLQSGEWKVDLEVIFTCVCIMCWLERVLYEISKTGLKCSNSIFKVVKMCFLCRRCLMFHFC